MSDNEVKEEALTKEAIIAQQMLEEKEADGKLRSYRGVLGQVITVLFLIWSVYQIWANTVGIVDAMAMRTWHLLFLLVFTFLLFPAYKGEKRLRSIPPVFDIVLLALTAVAFFYLLTHCCPVNFF